MQDQADTKLNRMVGEALKHKEGLIEELEKELNLERNRRETMNDQFQTELRKF